MFIIYYESDKDKDFKIKKPILFGGGQKKGVGG